MGVPVASLELEIDKRPTTQTASKHVLPFTLWHSSWYEGARKERYMVRAPEQIASGVYRVDATGRSNSISVLLITEGDGWALVDTGVQGSSLPIQEALASLGAGPSGLRRIYITHHDPDHIGGLPAVKWWAPKAEVVSSELEAQVISGKRTPDPVSNPLLRLYAQRLKLPTAPVDSVVQEGDLFAGFRVIATPGHTRGHTSLLRDEDGLLFTADAFGCLPRKIRVGVRKAVCMDPAQTKRSAEKLLAEEFTTVVFSHGKPLREGAKERLRKVVADCRYA
jgi:glyoxylase-like metal-dependent hydrolase (beta-lactamase superfamily II)